MSELFDKLRAGDAPAVRVLLDQDPSLVDATDVNGVSAILMAIYAGHRALADTLVERGAQVNLFEAAALGDVARITALLDASPELVNSFSPDGWTALHLACFFGARDAAELLLRRGADTAAWSKNGMRNTPLNAAAAAASGPRLEIVQLLLDHGAPVNAQQAGGFTSLHEAAFNGNVEIARALLAAGADPQLRNDAGQTALDMALAKGRQAVADLLDGQAGSESAAAG